jgi:hypothetical protein
MKDIRQPTLQHNLTPNSLIKSTEKKRGGYSPQSRFYKNYIGHYLRNTIEGVWHQ